MHYGAKGLWKQQTGYKVLNDRIKAILALLDSIHVLVLFLFHYYHCIFFIQLLDLKYSLDHFVKFGGSGVPHLAVAPQILA